MASGDESSGHFFTSASDATISHWVQVEEKVENNENGTPLLISCQRLAILAQMEKPAWRLRYDTSSHRLYSGDSTGQVNKMA